MPWPKKLGRNGRRLVPDPADCAWRTRECISICVACARARALASGARAACARRAAAAGAAADRTRDANTHARTHTHTQTHTHTHTHTHTPARRQTSTPACAGGAHAVRSILRQAEAGGGSDREAGPSAGAATALSIGPRRERGGCLCSRAVCFARAPVWVCRCERGGPWRATVTGVACVGARVDVCGCSCCVHSQCH